MIYPRHSRTLWATLALLPLTLAGSLAANDERVVVHSKIENCPVVVGEAGHHMQFLDLSERGFLGVEVASLTPELRQHFGVRDEEGVMISRLVEEGAAQQAGLQVGDIITRVGENSIASSSALGKAVRAHEGGDLVDVEYWRDGRQKQQTVTLAARETCSIDVGSYLEGVDWEEFAEMGAEIGARIGAETIENIDWEQFGNMGIRISQDAMAIALDSLQGVLEEGELERLLEHELEGVEVLHMENIEERMGRVQERLEQLEEQLERELQQVERNRERVERQVERNVERELSHKQRQLEHEERRLEREEQRRQIDQERLEREEQHRQMKQEQREQE